MYSFSLKSFCTTLLVILSIAFIQAADNIVFNSSFELGSKGFACLKFLRQDNNPEFKFNDISTDKSDAVSGSASLLLSNRFAEATELSSANFELKAESSYTFSFWLKASIENYPVYLSVVSQSPWKIHGSTQVNAGRNWARYSFSFKTDSSEGLKSSHIRILSGLKDSPVELRFDDFQLAEGSIRGYEPAAEIELSVEAVPFIFMDEGVKENCSVSLLLRNSASRTVGGKLKLLFSRNGEEFATESVSVLLESGKTECLNFKIPLRAFGQYRIRPEIKANATHIDSVAYVTVAGKYKAKTLDMNRDFCVGLNYDNGTASSPGWADVFGKDRVASGLKTKMDRQLFCKMLSGMGCRFIRPWDGGIQWQDIEKSEGEFDMSALDRLMEMKKLYGFEILTAAGGMDFVERDGKNDCKIPVWLKTRCRSLDFRELHRKAFLPPLDAWRHYVKALAEHGKGTLKYYEIMNEPNIIFPFSSQEEYLPYLKVAYEEIKAVDPEARVVGLCNTSDMGGRMVPFFETSFKGGALNFLDIISFHPYSSPELASELPADSNIEEIKKLLERYSSKKYPLWNTELYYLHESPRGASSDERASFEAYHAAWRFLTDLGEGLSQSMPLHASQLVGKDNVPHPAYVVYNTLARHFEGAKPVAKIKNNSTGTICYVYERGGELIAAAWKFKDSKVQTSIPQSVDLQILDMYGNKKGENKSGFSFISSLLNTQEQEILSSAPLYFKMRGMSMNKEDFVKMLKTSFAEVE